MNHLGILGLILALGSACLADDSRAVPIRIADGQGSRCINSSKDRIWLTMRRVITDKNEGWLKEDKSIAVIATTLVKSDPAAPKPLSFPLMTEATVAPYSKGQVSVPIEYSLIDGFNLAQDKVKYTGLQLEFTLLNIQGRNNRAMLCRRSTKSRRNCRCRHPPTLKRQRIYWTSPIPP